ncbi:MAG: histidine--tRNA ligase [Ilumatobacteraceae bacterium]
MPEFTTSPGMRDILAPEAARWRRFVDVFASVVEPAGYGFILPPLLEDYGVFRRIGDATDIVSKEMYRFTDLGGRDVALRPELTAGVCRAFVQHRPPTPWKVWCAGTNFRYEKPQRGRYRQFEQVDIEVLGVEDPTLDVEVIALGWHFFAALGLRQVELRLNSLGEPADRARYVDALRAHFDAGRETLSEESVQTLDRNPLRVLDSKRAPDQPLIALAPHMQEFLGAGAADHFAAVRAGLDALGIPYTIDARLVRGLDYYLRTTFEYAGATLQSAQNALGGGGRYDGLVEALGGPATGGIGLAIGVDRTLLACNDEGVFPPLDLSVDVFVVDTTGGGEALAITDEVRRAGRSADRAWDGRSMRAQMKAADRSRAAVAVIVGDDERAAGTAVVRPLRTSDAEQVVVPRDELLDHLEKVLT